MKKLFKQRNAKKLQSAIHGMVTKTRMEAEKELGRPLFQVRQTGKTTTMTVRFIQLSGVVYEGTILSPAKKYLNKYKKAQYETVV